MMNYEERLKEANRLKQVNQAILSTPLMSEGNISPMQVGLFSRRQKERWQKDTMAKMTLEHAIKQLRRSDAEVANDEARIQDSLERERLATIGALQSKIDFIHSLGRMSHRANGNLRPAYKRTIDAYLEELGKLDQG